MAELSSLTPRLLFSSVESCAASCFSSTAICASISSSCLVFAQVFDAPFFALLRGDLLLRGGDLFADVGRAAARRPELFLELQLFQVELDAVDRADGLSGREPPAFFHAERSNSSVGFRGYDHFGRLERPGGVVTVFIAAAGRRPGAKRENQKSFHISCWLYFSGCMSS